MDLVKRSSGFLRLWRRRFSFCGGRRRAVSRPREYPVHRREADSRMAFVRTDSRGAAIPDTHAARSRMAGLGFAPRCGHPRAAGRGR
jgi:hypothetical protein